MIFLPKTCLTALQVSRFVGKRYARFSDAWPHTAAGLTAFCILGSADITAQFFERRYGNRAGGWNARRTLSLVVFGVYYYGGPCKWLYLRYPAFIDRMLPKSPKPMKKMAAAFLDCGIVTQLLLFPSFYLITMSIKGEPLPTIWNRYKADFFEATVGTFLFWFPIVSTNFYFVPQHSQVLVIVTGSFIHKCWLSWVSNRYTNPNQSDTPYSKMLKNGEEAIQQGLGADYGKVLEA
jgi:protein Mpv17